MSGDAGCCAQCGFAFEPFDRDGACKTITAGSGELAGLLVDTRAADLGRRREQETWSVIEYGCHLRDVLLVQRERVLLARRVDVPVFEPMGRDDRVEHDGYDEQEPHDVARQLADAAAMFVNVVRRLSPADLERRAVYPYPEPTERTLAWVVANTGHEVVHHLGDVRAQLG